MGGEVNGEDDGQRRWRKRRSEKNGPVL